MVIDIWNELVICNQKEKKNEQKEKNDLPFSKNMLSIFWSLPGGNLEKDNG